MGFTFANTFAEVDKKALIILKDATSSQIGMINFDDFIQLSTRKYGGIFFP
jgi:hypothetical protein